MPQRLTRYTPRLLGTAVLAAALWGLSACSGTASPAPGSTANSAPASSNAAASEAAGTPATATPAASGTTQASGAAATGEAASPTPTPEDFAPVMGQVTEKKATLSTTDAAGQKLRLVVSYPVPKVTGVAPETAARFAQQVKKHYLDQLDERLQNYRQITLMECGATPIAELAGKPCTVTAHHTLVGANVHGDFAGVASTTSYMVGSRLQAPVVQSLTMNLRTGKVARLKDVMDLSEPSALGRAAHAVESHENWPYTCLRDETPRGYARKAQAFVPTQYGLTLLWSTDPSAPATCQVDRVSVPWEDAGAHGGSTAEGRGAGIEAVNGDWCPTQQSGDTLCVNITFPRAVYADGTTVKLTGGPSEQGFSLGQPGAPFGEYVPAGVKLSLPDYYSGHDLPDRERIWNSQTNTLLVRK